MSDSRQPITYKMEQTFLNESMTPLEKMMAISSITNLVINLLTDGKKSQSDLRDDHLEKLNEFQYILFVNPKTRKVVNPNIGHIYNGIKGLMVVGGLKFK
jgi:hypothetical protein